MKDKKYIKTNYYVLSITLKCQANGCLSKFIFFIIFTKALSCSMNCTGKWPLSRNKQSIFFFFIKLNDYWIIQQLDEKYELVKIWIVWLDGWARQLSLGKIKIVTKNCYANLYVYLKQLFTQKRNKVVVACIHGLTSAYKIYNH